MLGPSQPIDEDPPLVVNTTAGPVRGTTVKGHRCWKGIRYAAPPTGELRWRAPQPPEPWAEIAETVDFGPVCPQPMTPAVALPADATFDEDCLNLNVWTSASCTPQNPGPVLFWVHGGAYIFGSSSQPIFDATALVSAKPLVVVTINYRLGALGFLDLTSFGDEGTFDSNVALRDVLLALHWVQDNIAAFGGDPRRVTMMGQSAGAGLVTALLTVPDAEGLFARAIAHSSPATSVYDSERAAKVAGQYLDIAGVSPAEAEHLRDLPVDDIVAAGFTLYSSVPAHSPGTLAYTPIVDGKLLPGYPLDRVRAGLSIPVPLLIGTNKDEAAVFKFMKSPLMPITSDTIMTMFSDLAADNPALSLPSEAQIGSAYVGVSQKAKGLGVARDLGFRMPTIWFAEGHSHVAPVYLFRFDWATAMLRLLGLGATHATELPYLWGNLVSGPKDITFRLGGQTAGRRISQRMQARWLAFVFGDQPDAGPSEPRWPAYTCEPTSGTAPVASTAASRATLVIDHRDRLEFDLDAELRAAWGDEVLNFL